MRAARLHGVGCLRITRSSVSSASAVGNVILFRILSRDVKERVIFSALQRRAQPIYPARNTRRNMPEIFERGRYEFRFRAARAQFRIDSVYASLSGLVGTYVAFARLSFSRIALLYFFRASLDTRYFASAASRGTKRARARTCRVM